MHLPCSKQNCWLILAIVFVIALIVSLALTFAVIPNIIDSEIDKNTRLEHDTDQFDRFVELPIPLDFKINIFQTLNPTEVENGGIPELEEIGPYVYKEYRNKTILFENNTEDTISFTQMQTFIFDESNGKTEDEPIQIVNAVLIIILQVLEELNMGILSSCMETVLGVGNDGLFLNIKPKELIFEGFPFCYDDIEPLPCRLICLIASNIKFVHRVEGEKHLRFSIFNYKIRSDDGLYTIKRGIDDISQLGEIIRWNNETYTSFWREEKTSCDKIHGTDSTLYPPKMTKDNVPVIYATDICRSVSLKYSGESTYKDIVGYLYTADRSVVQSIKPYADCYCSNTTRNVDGKFSCYLDGVINLSPCFNNIPALLSFPHFLYADEKYLEQVKNLAPDQKKHQTFLNIEPNTGTPLQGAKRIQINVVVRNTLNYKTIQNVKGTMYPLLWLDETIELNDELIDTLNELYFNQVQMATIVEYSLIGISAALTILFGGLYVHARFF